MADVAVDWHCYFESIKRVCPWSWSAWQRGAIDIQLWRGQVYPLGSWSARVYMAPNHNSRQLKKQMDKLNTARDDEEWLYSHPRFGNNSAPIPCLIQQDYNTLQNIREKANYKQDL